MQNFQMFEAGGWKDLHQHLFEVGPLRKAGKVFLAEHLQSTGMEVSLNRIEPGDGYEFLHRHQTHEEVYLIVSGTGDFQWMANSFQSARAPQSESPQRALARFERLEL